MSSSHREFETQLRPSSRGLLNEFDPPEPPTLWFHVKAAQLKMTKLQRRAHTFGPSLFTLIIGIAFGLSPLPLMAKNVTGLVAGLLLVWVVISYLAQKRTTNRLYSRLKPDHQITITKE